MTKGMWTTLATAAVMTMVTGCEQTPAQRQADAVRQESKDKAEQVKERTDNTAEAIKDQAEKLEDAGERKADAIKAEGERKAEAIEEGRTPTTTPNP